MELQLRADHQGRVLGVGSSSSTAAVNIRRNVVNLLAVFIGYNWAVGRSRVCTKNNAILKLNNQTL